VRLVLDRELERVLMGSGGFLVVVCVVDAVGEQREIAAGGLEPPGFLSGDER
jgi:hypothetical protein